MLPSTPRLSAPLSGPPSPSPVLTAGDVISRHLVAFSDITALQEQNRKLLLAVRELGDRDEQRKAVRGLWREKMFLRGKSQRTPKTEFSCFVFRHWSATCNYTVNV